MWGTPGGKTGEGWVGGPKECRHRGVAEHEGVRRANEARASVSEAEVAAFGETLIFGGSRRGSPARRRRKVPKFLPSCSKTLGVETATALLARAIRTRRWTRLGPAAGTNSRGRYAACQAWPRAEGQGGFLGGKAPDPSDINLGGAVYTVKALIDSGLADSTRGCQGSSNVTVWCRGTVGWLPASRRPYLVSRRWRARHRRDSSPIPAAQGLRPQALCRDRAELRQQACGRARRVPG